MAVDVSHCGDKTTLDAFELSKRPVLITHSNCRALAPGHPRVKTDEAIKAMGKSGGVMGISAVRIRALAREMAATRTTVNINWSLQRSHHGEQPFWALWP